MVMWWTIMEMLLTVWVQWAFPLTFSTDFNQTLSTKTFVTNDILKPSYTFYESNAKSLQNLLKHNVILQGCHKLNESDLYSYLLIRTDISEIKVSNAWNESSELLSHRTTEAKCPPSHKRMRFSSIVQARRVLWCQRRSYYYVARVLCKVIFHL